MFLYQHINSGLLGATAYRHSQMNQIDRVNSSSYMPVGHSPPKVNIFKENARMRFMLCIMCGDGSFGKAKDDASLSSDETLCPSHAPAYLEYRVEIGLGDQCCRQDRCSYAIPHYDRALGIFPKSPEASYQKSIALIRLNKYNRFYA